MFVSVEFGSEIYSLRLSGTRKTEKSKYIEFGFDHLDALEPNWRNPIQTDHLGTKSVLYGVIIGVSIE